MRGDDGWVEMDEGAGVLSGVCDASEGWLRRFGCLGSDSRRADQLARWGSSGQQR